MPDFDVAEADRLLTTTRAVRKRLDLTRQVPPEVIIDCIDVASQAPSGSNSQAWRWVAVTDPDTRTLIAGIYRDAFEQYIVPRKEGVQANTSGDRIVDSAEYLATHMAEVPVLMIPCALGRTNSVSPERGASFFGGVLPAVWSFQLALRARGLGSAWTTLHLRQEKVVADALGIPDGVTQCALLPVAYYTGETFQRAPRRPASEVTCWNRWENVGGAPAAGEPVTTPS